MELSRGTNRGIVDGRTRAPSVAIRRIGSRAARLQKQEEQHKAPAVLGEDSGHCLHLIEDPKLQSTANARL